MVTVTSREAALSALGAWRKNGAWPEAYLNSLVRREGMERRDAALTYRLVYGVIQNVTLCDWCISAYSAIPMNKIQPIVLDIIRIGVYQLCFMNRIPAHAAVSESVKLARKKANPSAAGFVNAILRKIANQGIPEITAEDDIEYLSVKYSHPRWLTERIVDELGRENGERYLACDNELAPVCAQVNTLKATTDQVISSLTADGVSVRRAMDGLELMGTGDPSELTVFKNGSIFIQDNAANLAVRVADPKPDMWVLDGCAAPGGKSFAAAVLMENRGRILSRDIHEKKLGRITREAARLGIDIIETEAGDARTFRPELEKRFDVVIADVPCSGLGVIRKKPDIRFKKPEDIEGLPEIQLAILTNLAKCCKPGGTVLYSTCTVLKRENGDVVRRFLNENSGFRLEPFDMSEDGMVTLYPHIHGTDGFFIARLRRDNE